MDIFSVTSSLLVQHYIDKLIFYTKTYKHYYKTCYKAFPVAETNYIPTEWARWRGIFVFLPLFPAQPHFTKTEWAMKAEEGGGERNCRGRKHESTPPHQPATITMLVFGNIRHGAVKGM